MQNYDDFASPEMQKQDVLVRDLKVADSMLDYMLKHQLQQTEEKLKRLSLQTQSVSQAQSVPVWSLDNLDEDCPICWEELGTHGDVVQLQCPQPPGADESAPHLFHLECIALTPERGGELADVFECPECDPERETLRHEAVYCLCRGPAGEGGMVECDDCHEWMHLRCIGIADGAAGVAQLTPAAGC